MSNINVGFIGAGRIAKIILGGWKRADKMPARVVLYDCEAKARDELASIGPCVEATGNIADAAGQNVVFKAVHPPVMKETATAIKDHLKSDALVVSLAPKFTITKLSELLGGFDRIARTIPNVPSLIGRGYNPVSCGTALKEADRRTLHDLLAPLGNCPEVDESHLEAYAILSAMGPTYFWPQIYALKALGESFGLTGEATMAALDKMLWGAVATIRESGLSSEQILDLIPVKPMTEEVASLCDAYKRKLQGLMEKIRP